MPLSSSEALRLSRECVPKMIENEDLPADFDLDLNERDLIVKDVCRLWAGMGYIYDVTIRGHYHFIVKHIVPPPKRSRSFGDQRKAASYEVEANFYRHVAPMLITGHNLSIPAPYHVENNSDKTITICMSRLEGSPGYLSDDDKIHAALKWMATLHAATWGKADELVEEKGLQPIGSYWHLDTRPSEHDSMPRRGWEGRLKRAARAIDERLKRDSMQCVVHGDLKDANMLFSNDSVGIYDFQYCGKAPPTVDLAYFFCVAVGDTDDGCLEFYHNQLVCILVDKKIKPPTFEQLKESLSIAFCDFQRFMSGWGNWGSDISHHVIGVLDTLDHGSMLSSEDAYREAMIKHFG